jgi:endonuclease III
MGKEITTPVNSHVFIFMKSLNLTNAKSDDDCSWKIQKYTPKGRFIKSSSSIRGLGQIMAMPDGRRTGVIAATKHIALQAL